MLKKDIITKMKNHNQACMDEALNCYQSLYYSFKKDLIPCIQS